MDMAIVAFLLGVVVFLFVLRRIVRTMPRETERQSYRRWRTCTRKRAYDTRKQAQTVVHRHAREGDVVHAYRCPWCRRWHVGHPQPLRRG